MSGRVFCSFPQWNLFLCQIKENCRIYDRRTFLSDRWSLCEFWYYICIFFLFCLLKWTAQSSVFDNVMLTSPDVSDKFKFSPTLLSYVLPSLAPFLAASEIFCLFNYDLRCFKSSIDYLYLCLWLFSSMLSLEQILHDFSPRLNIEAF